MPENVSIAYRGANFAIGQGPQFYGIWHAVATQSQPIEWWPLTPEGWSGAWGRFASVEVPGTIAPVTNQQPVMQQASTLQGPAAAPSAGSAPAGSAPSGAATAEPATAGPATAGPAVGVPAVAGLAAARSAPDPATAARGSRIAAGVIGLGVVLGIAGLFPAYVAGASLASSPSDVVAHAIYLAAWTLSGVLIVLGGTRLRAGALIGLGVSAVTFGLFFADVGTQAASGSHSLGAGLILSILGWLACTAGAGLASRTARPARTHLAGNGAAQQRGLPYLLRRLARHEIAPTVTLVLAAVGTAIAFAPSWDKFTLKTASGVSQTITEGNAFANPGWVITGDVLVMVAFVVVVIMAALRPPMRLGAALAIGAIIPMVAQAISAIVQINGAGVTSPLQFGITPSQATQVGLTISAGLTPMFWVFCAFVATLILLCGWLLLAHESAVPDRAALNPAGQYGGGQYVAGPYAGGQYATGQYATGPNAAAPAGAPPYGAPFSTAIGSSEPGPSVPQQ